MAGSFRALVLAAALAPVREAKVAFYQLCRGVVPQLAYGRNLMLPTFENPSDRGPQNRK